MQTYTQEQINQMMTCKQWKEYIKDLKPTRKLSTIKKVFNFYKTLTQVGA